MNGSNTNSINMVRMNKSMFSNLCSIMRQKSHMGDTLHITIDEQLLMFLHTIRHNQRNLVIAHNFLKSGKTYSMYFNHVLYTQLANYVISMCIHLSTQTPTYIALRSTLYPYFNILTYFLLTLNLLSYNQFLIIMC